MKISKSKQYLFNRGLFVLSLLFLNSCYVCDNFYVPNNQNSNWEESFTDSLVTVSSWTPASAKNVIITSIQFNTKDSIDIKNIELNIHADGKIIPLRNVEAKSFEAGISPLKDDIYRQPNFKALPDVIQVTRINDNAVSFIFYFEDKGPVDVTTVNASIKIELTGDDGNLEFNRHYELMKKRACSFRVH